MLAIAVVIAALSSAISQSASAGDPLKPGTVIDSVACQHDPSQRYALYLPSRYSPDRAWPILYAFDPFARGKVPVEFYKQAAEKYGYIVVGSNNAKNGPGALEMAAAQAVWQDTHVRFKIDKVRVYTTGLSGGARFATSFALYCYTCVVAGVIAEGATYPVKEGLPASDHFLYYVAAGDQDFNLPEILELRRRKDEQHTDFKVKIYSGPHQWAPPEIQEDAVEWLQLKAMQGRKTAPDDSFVRGLLEKTLAEASDAEKTGNVLAQYYALRSVMVDFKGLEDVSRYKSQFDDLRKSKQLQQALRQENHEIDKQRSLTRDASRQIAEFGQAPPDVQSKLRPQLISVFSDLRRQAKSKSTDHLVFVRAFNDLWVQGMEDGQEEFRKKEYVIAAAYFELMADVAPDQSWPMVLLAETRVRTGDRKAALKALEQAVKRGVKSRETLTQNPELAPLAAEPAFQKIVQETDGSK
jgi:hypothetical protein